MSSLSRLACLGAVVAFTACVPASEALPPAGAGGFATQPSPATRGEPFVTEDGWTVRIEKVVLSCWVTTAPPLGSSYNGRRYGSGGWLFDASKPVALYAPEVSIGPAVVDISLRGNYVYVGRDNNRESRRILDVSPEVVERSNAPPDEGFEDAYFGDDLRYPAGDGPSVLLAVRAERAGRVERLDLALGITSYSGFGGRFSVDIVEDTVVTRPVGVSVEELFRDGKGRLAFDELAAADTDGDGTITIAELKAAPTTCKCPITAPAHPSGPRPEPDLVDLLELNAVKVLSPR